MKKGVEHNQLASLFSKDNIDFFLKTRSYVHCIQCSLDFDVRKPEFRGLRPNKLQMSLGIPTV